MKYIYNMSILCCLLLLVFCGKDTAEECLPGHILILYVGDSEKPVRPLILKTKDDTTYIKYTRLDKYKDDEYSYLIGIHEYELAYCTFTINHNTYKKLKETLIKKKQIENSTYTHPFETYKFIIYDRCDSIAYYGSDRDQVDSLFSDIIDILKKNELNMKIINRIERYRYKKIE